VSSRLWTAHGQHAAPIKGCNAQAGAGFVPSSRAACQIQLLARSLAIYMWPCLCRYSRAHSVGQKAEVPMAVCISARGRLRAEKYRSSKCGPNVNSVAENYVQDKTVRLSTYLSDEFAGACRHDGKKRRLDMCTSPPSSPPFKRGVGHDSLSSRDVISALSSPFQAGGCNASDDEQQRRELRLSNSQGACQRADASAATDSSRGVAQSGAGLSNEENESSRPAQGGILNSPRGLYEDSAPSGVPRTRRQDSLAIQHPRDCSDPSGALQHHHDAHAASLTHALCAPSRSCFPDVQCVAGDPRQFWEQYRSPQILWSPLYCESCFILHYIDWVACWEDLCIFVKPMYRMITCSSSWTR
jgi:hypothetical protein